VLLKSDKSNRYFTGRRFRVYDDISLNFSYNEKTFRKKVVQKIKTHILCSITFFPENGAVYENVEKCGGAREATNGVTIWRIRVACWISKVTRAPARAYTHRQKYLMLALFPRLQLFLNVTLYVHCLRC
jgi:hypothetical protein